MKCLDDTDSCSSEIEGRPRPLVCSMEHYQFSVDYIVAPGMLSSVMESKMVVAAHALAVRSTWEPWAFDLQERHVAVPVGIAVARLEAQLGRDGGGSFDMEDGDEVPQLLAQVDVAVLHAFY